MSPGQQERLTALDASFLHQETPAAHMHVGGLTLFEGPAPTLIELEDHLRGRLHLVPRYRQKLLETPLQSGRPLWIDDADFDLARHVHEISLTGAGDDAQLHARTADIFARPLDREGPLWEMWLVTGVSGGRFALVVKTHHAMIDGVSGVDIAQVIFDLTPTPVEVPHPEEAWTPTPEPTQADVLAGNALDAARGGLMLARRIAGAALRPQSALAALAEGVQGLGEVVQAGLDPAPATPLNVDIGPDRRYTTRTFALADLKAIKAEFGGTVNDVILASVSGALRTWLHERQVSTDGLDLRALVPVSIRAASEHGQLGNRIAVMRGPLPVRIADPLDRLRAVRAAMDGLKESKQAVGAEVLASVQNFAPPTVLAQASRLNFSTRLFNMIVTNVPGPQFPLYVLGRRMLAAFPIAFLPTRHALAVAIMSYDGEVNFGLLADRDALPDLAVIADGIAEEIETLLELTRTRSA